MIRLYLDSEEVDLYESPDTSITYAHSNIEGLGDLDIKGNYSYEFELPATSRNKKFFKFPEFALSDSFDETSEKTALLEKDGSIILNGFARIKSTIRKDNTVNYKILLYDGNSGWIKSIKGLKLSDIDLVEYDHSLTVSNILNSENFQLTNLYTYGLFDMGGTDPLNFTVKDRTIMFNVWKLLQSMLLDQGYKFESSFLNTDFFQNLFISSNKQLERKDSELIPHKFSVAQGINFVSFSSDSRFIFTALTSSNLDTSDKPAVWESSTFSELESQYNGILPVINLYNDGASTVAFESVPVGVPAFLGAPQPTISAHFYKVNNFYGAMSFSWDYNFLSTRLSLFNTSREFPLLLKFKRIRNGSVSTLETRNELIPKPAAYESRATGNFTTLSIDVEAGDRYYFTAKIDTTQNVTNYGIFFDEYSLLSNKVFNTVTKGAPVTIADQLPDMLQSDFIKSVKKAFNLVFNTNEASKIIYIEPRDDFYNATAIDWSEKLDKSKPIQITNLGSRLAKEIEFKYRRDSSDKYVELLERKLNNPIHSIRVAIDNQSAKDGTISKGLSFAATAMVKGTFENLTDVEIPRIWSEEEDPEAKIDKFAPRLLFYRGKQNVGSGNYKFEGVVYSKYPSFTINYLDYTQPSITHSNSLRWNDTDYNYGLYSRFYAGTIKTLNEGRKVEASFYLNEVDIQEFNPRAPVYVEDSGDGNYYIVQKIKDYAPGKIGSIKVELIKLIETDPLPEKLSIQTSNIFEGSGKDEEIESQPPNPQPQENNVVYTTTVWTQTAANPTGEWLEVEQGVMCFDSNSEGQIKNNFVEVVV